MDDGGIDGFGAGAGPPAALAEGMTGAVAVGAVPRPSRSSSRAISTDVSRSPRRSSALRGSGRGSAP